MNVELFKKVQTAIETEGLEMTTWERKSEQASGCKTTRCLAGWGIALTTNAPVYTWRKSPGGWHENLDVSSATHQLALSLGVSDDIPQIAGRLFGLTLQEENVFYLSERVVTEFIDLAAAGQVDEARAHLNDSLADAGF